MFSGGIETIETKHWSEMGQKRNLFKANRMTLSNYHSVIIVKFEKAFSFSLIYSNVWDKKYIEYQIQDYSPPYPLKKQQRQ